MKKLFGLSWLFIGFLVACQTTTPPTLPPAVTNTPLVVPTTAVVAEVPPTFTPVPEATATAEPTVTTAPTNTLQPSSTPTPSTTPSPAPMATPTFDLILPQMTPRADTYFSVLRFANDSTQPFEDVILFTSQSYNPFAPSPASVVSEEPQFENSQFNLWARSADGVTWGGLSDVRGSIFVHYQPNQAKPFSSLAVYGGGEFNEDITNIIAYPPECDGIFSAEEQQRIDTTDFGCGDFNNSPNARFISMYFQPDNCGRGLIVLDMTTGETVFRRFSGVHYFEFVNDEYALVQAGHCEGGGVSLLNLADKSDQLLGASGRFINWNPQKTAFVVESVFHATLLYSVFGYSFESNQLFLSPSPSEDESAQAITSRPMWLPGGQYLAYQYHAYIQPNGYNFETSNKILVAEVLTGLTTAELHDPAYNYFLIEEKSKGDWIAVERFPFVPETVPFYSADYDYDCLIFGEKCSTEPELMGYNWQTGELLPWAEVPQTELTPTPSPPAVAPDLSQPPLYQHPSGDYTLYVGTDGRTLWVVPRLGDPFIWVYDGQNFTYIP